MARWIMACDTSRRRSQSPTKRRWRSSQPKVRSTTQRRGSTWKPTCASRHLMIDSREVDHQQAPVGIDANMSLAPVGIDGNMALALVSIDSNMALAPVDLLARVMAAMLGALRGPK